MPNEEFEFLREEQFRDGTADEPPGSTVIADVKPENLRVRLRHGIDDLGAERRGHLHAVTPHRPALLAWVQQPKPRHAVEDVESARTERTGDGVEMV